MTKASPQHISAFGFCHSFVLRPSSLFPSGSFQQRRNHIHSLSFRSARSKLCDASLDPPRPIRASCRAGDIEAVVSDQQICNHDDGNPGVALEKGLHDGRIKALFKIDFIDVRINAGEQGDFRQIESRLLRRGCWPFESLFP